MSEDISELKIRSVCFSYISSLVVARFHRAPKNEIHGYKHVSFIPSWSGSSNLYTSETKQSIPASNKDKRRALYVLHYPNNYKMVK